MPSRSLEQRKAQLLLLGIVFLWGATFSLVKAVLGDVSPLLFNSLRFSIATAVLAALNHRALATLTRSQLQAGALAGLFLALGYQFQTLGLARTSPTKSAFLTGLVVLFVPLLSFLPLIRRSGTRPLGRAAAAGAMSAFAGLVLLTTPAGTSVSHLLVSVRSGDLLTLLCALAFAAHLLTLARVSGHMPAPLLGTLQVSFATLFMLLTLPLEHPQAHLTSRLVITLLLCGVLGTAAAFTVQSFAQRLLPPTQTVVLLTLEPVFAALTSIVLFHEVLTPRSLLGAALILASIAMTELLVPRT